MSSKLAPHITHILQERFAPTCLDVVDESHKHAGHAGANGTGFDSHFYINIRSDAFEGLRPVACHRLIYEALDALITDHGIHALRIQAHS